MTRIASDRLVRILYYLFLLGIVIALGAAIKLLLSQLIGVILITLLLTPPVNYLEAKGIPRPLAIILMYALFLGFIVTSLLFFIPTLLREFEAFVSQIPQYAQQISIELTRLHARIQDMFPNNTIPDMNTWFKSTIVDTGKNMNVSKIVSHLSGILSVASVLFVVPLLSFFLLLDGAALRRVFISIIPNRYFEITLLLLHNTIDTLKRFVRGQILDAMVVGIMSSIALSLIGLPYGIAIGVFAGICSVIPYLGSVMGYIPAVAVVIFNPAGFTITDLIPPAIALFIVQFIESNFVYPLLVGKSVNLHPAVVLLALTVGGTIGGILGMLLAVPILSMVNVIIQLSHRYLKRYDII